MEFEDTEINTLEPSKPENACILIVKYLCSENYDPLLFEKDEGLLSTLVGNAKRNGLDHRQLNELLLLLNQDKVSEDFFNFFFEKAKIQLEDLKKGIMKFRTFAMLCFGNFRFAYKQLIRMNEKELETRLWPYCREPSKLKEGFKKRSLKMLEIKRIPRDETWYLGYISGRKLKNK